MLLFSFLCGDVQDSCTPLCVCVCVCVCPVCVYKQAVEQGPISHMWRKWGNLRPGVKKVMDFNAVIVVNGSLN